MGHNCGFHSTYWCGVGGCIPPQIPLTTHQAAYSPKELVLGVPHHHTLMTQDEFPSTLSGQLILVHHPQEMDQPLLRSNYHLFFSNTLPLIEEIMAVSLGLKHCSGHSSTEKSLPSTHLGESASSTSTVSILLLNVPPLPSTLKGMLTG